MDDQWQPCVVLEYHHLLKDYLSHRALDKREYLVIIKIFCLACEAEERHMYYKREYLVIIKIFCLACEAEARHMYCFSGVVVVVGLVGGVNFLVFRSFSRKL